MKLLRHGHAAPNRTASIICQIVLHESEIVYWSSLQALVLKGEPVQTTLTIEIATIMVCPKPSSYLDTSLNLLVSSEGSGGFITILIHAISESCSSLTAMRTLLLPPC